MEGFGLPSCPQNRLPRFWNGLSASDQTGYLSLRAELGTPKFSNQRGRSKAQFRLMLDLIKAYAVRGDSDDLWRSLVCGIIWLSNGIAVNIQQLKLLSSKCKSSINGSFGQLGYLPMPSGADTAEELIQKFPFMKDQFSELRQWTIRRVKDRPPKLDIDLEPEFSEAHKFDIFGGMSLEEEYTKLFAEICPSGSLNYPTPPAYFEDGIDIGITIRMGSPDGHTNEKFDCGNQIFQNDLLF
jgi:hypothetical protein